MPASPTPRPAVPKWAQDKTEPRQFVKSVEHSSPESPQSRRKGDKLSQKHSNPESPQTPRKEPNRARGGCAARGPKRCKQHFGPSWATHAFPQSKRCAARQTQALQATLWMRAGQHMLFPIKQQTEPIGGWRRSIPHKG